MAHSAGPMTRRPQGNLALFLHFHAIPTGTQCKGHG